MGLSSIVLTSPQDLVYAKTPAGAIRVKIMTEDGMAQSTTKGGVRAYISLSPFPISYAPADIVIHFGQTAVPVSRLRASSPSGTRVDVIVPPGELGTQVMHLFRLEFPPPFLSLLGTALPP
jgi:hypothetical protein